MSRLGDRSTSQCVLVRAKRSLLYAEVKRVALRPAPLRIELRNLQSDQVKSPRGTAGIAPPRNQIEAESRKASLPLLSFCLVQRALRASGPLPADVPMSAWRSGLFASLAPIAHDDADGFIDAERLAVLLRMEGA